MLCYLVGLDANIPCWPCVGKRQRDSLCVDRKGQLECDDQYWTLLHSTKEHQKHDLISTESSTVKGTAAGQMVTCGLLYCGNPWLPNLIPSGDSLTIPFMAFCSITCGMASWLGSSNAGLLNRPALWNKGPYMPHGRVHYDFSIKHKNKLKSLSNCQYRTDRGQSCC